MHLYGIQGRYLKINPFIMNRCLSSSFQKVTKSWSLFMKGVWLKIGDWRHVTNFCITIATWCTNNIWAWKCHVQYDMGKVCQSKSNCPKGRMVILKSGLCCWLWWTSWSLHRVQFCDDLGSDCHYLSRHERKSYPFLFLTSA